jgi:hypothetical protein
MRSINVGTELLLIYTNSAFQASGLNPVTGRHVSPGNRLERGNFPSAVPPKLRQTGRRLIGDTSAGFRFVLLMSCR